MVATACFGSTDESGLSKIFLCENLERFKSLLKCADQVFDAQDRVP